MLKMNRRNFLAVATAILPSFLLPKATGAAASKDGTLLTKSSSIKVGQTLGFDGKDGTGRTLSVYLSRTKNGLVALDGTCTHQGCAVALKKKQLICPCHGSIFQAESGSVVLGPNGAPKTAIRALAKYKVTEKSGNIYIR